MLKLAPLFALLLAHGSTALAADNPAPRDLDPTPLSQNAALDLAAPEIEAKAYLLQGDQPQVDLISHGADLEIAPASLTKLMTAYVVFKALETGEITLETTLPISEKAWKMPGSRMFLEVGKSVTVEALLQGLIIQSGNDAATALAEGIGEDDGTAFVSRMNEMAKKLGMVHSNFTNPVGFTLGVHHTSAQDLAIIARALVHEFPQYYRWFGEKSYTYNDITQENRNRLLWLDESVDGFKTGFTDDAGYCLLASALRDGKRYYAVVLGTESPEKRVEEAKRLLEYAFALEVDYQLLSTEESLSPIPIIKGATPTVMGGIAEPITLKMNRAVVEKSQYQVRFEPEAHLEAPITKGQLLGRMQIYEGERLLESVPLEAQDDLARASLWQLFMHEVKALTD